MDYAVNDLLKINISGCIDRRDDCNVSEEWEFKGFIYLLQTSTFIRLNNSSFFGQEAPLVNALSIEENP
ncbi:MAG: hypothetical protein IPM04_14775 [Saprospiraceae bacterium]|nr:hypothetical protein [Candidatus Brachybacter algidus]MBK8749033.1 hypothetical protein [Candidatus Brachybacter algidus]